MREAADPNRTGAGRAAAIGLLSLALVIGISVAGCFSAFLRYDLIGTGHLPRSALYPLLVLLGVNALVRRFTRLRGLRRSEMLFVYCTLVVMSGIPGQQFATYLYMGLVGPIYYATPQNQWGDPVNGFHQHIRDWMVPSKDPNAPVVRWLFEGLPEGAGFRDIPWDLWVRPLVVWTPFCFLIFFVTICICVVLRKQWVENERLLFPLAQVPLDMTREGPGRTGVAALFRKRAFWIAFAIPVFIYIVNGINAYAPAFPRFNLYPRWFADLFSDRPWNIFNRLWVGFYFGMIGIAYMLTWEVGFSLIFFHFFRYLHEIARVMAGAERHGEHFRALHIGAVLALGIFYIWMGRRHFADVLRKAFTNTSRVDDSREPLGYRGAVLGIVLGMAGILGWCWAAGISVWLAAIMFGWYFLAILVLTRIVSETGVFVYWFGIYPHQLAMYPFGTGNLTRQNVAVLSMIGFQLTDAATCIQPQVLKAFKIGDVANLNRRVLFVMITLAILVSMLACHVPSIWVMYRTGIPNLGWWSQSAARFAANVVAGPVYRNEVFRPGEYPDMALGGAFTLFLVFMRKRFLWWPFHPLGFVVNTTWTMGRYWWAVFLGWSIKSVVTWLGGVKLWRRLYPAAIGLILGEAFILFTWLMIHFFFPIEGVLIIE